MVQRASFTAAVIAVTIAVPAPAKTADAPPPRAPQEIIPLYVSRARPVAMLTIGNNPPSPVAFDTGTTDNILKPDYAARLGLKSAGSTVLKDAATGKSQPVPLVATPDAALSGVKLAEDTANVFPAGTPDEVGIFGPNSFGDRLVIFEGPLNRVRVIDRDAGWAPVGPGLAYRNGLPSIEIKVAGKAVIAHLDSGNDSELILGSALLPTIKLKAPPTVVAVAQSALGETEVLGGTLAGTVSIGPIRLTDPDVTFGGGANVGFGVLRRLRVVLDPRNQRSWVLDPAVGTAPLSAYAGQYGPRRIWVEGKRLMHQREGRPPFALTPLGSDLFEMQTGDEIQFRRKSGRIVGLDLITVEGEVVPAERSR